jgi:hypothetical protein
MISRRVLLSRSARLLALGAGASVLSLSGCESKEVQTIPKLTKSREEIEAPFTPIAGRGKKAAEAEVKAKITERGQGQDH